MKSDIFSQVNVSHLAPGRWALKLLIVISTLSFLSCGSEEDETASGDLDKTCEVDTSKTVKTQEDALTQRLLELGDGSDELLIRTSELGQLYPLGSMLNNGNRLRGVDNVASNSLEPQALRNVDFNSERTAFDGETSSYGALVGYYGVGVAAELKESEGSNVVFQANLEITDLELHAINDVDKMIDNNRLRSPNAHQFVHGVYYGNVRTSITFEVSCHELSEESVSIVYEYFEANESFAVNKNESSNISYVIESREPVPIAYLIREFEPVAPVSNLSGSVNEGPKVTIDWDYTGPSTNFRVFYSQSADFNIGDDDVRYTDVDQANFTLTQQLELGESWHFRVATVSGGNIGAPSESLTITIPASWPATPLVLLGNPLGSGEVKLRWGRPEGNSANLYTIFRRESADEGWAEYKTLAQDNPAQRENFRLREFIDSEVLLGKTYHYQITYSNWLSPPNSPQSQEVIVKVVDEIIVNNEGPVADAGPVTFANEKDTVQLNGSGSYDPDSARALTYDWQASPENPFEVSISDRNQAVASIVAPEIDEAIVSLEFILTVSDGSASATDTVQINVQNVVAVPADNNPPEAFLKTPKLRLREGDVIRLDASESIDPDNDPLSFSWRQFNDDGIELQLADKTQAQLEVNAPFDLLEDKEITFVVIVSDGELTDSEQVTIQLESRGDINEGLEVKVDTQHGPLEQEEGTLWAFEVSNTSSFPRENVKLEVFYPFGPMAGLFNGYISKNGACAAPGRNDRCDTENETITWNLGTLQAGQGIRVSIPPAVSTTASLDAEITVNARVTDDFGSADTDTGTVALIDNRWLQLHLAADHNPVAAGEKQQYRLTYGFNETSKLASETQLTLVLPAGLVFVSASDDGQIENNIITWELGDILPGESGVVTATVKADDTLPSGTLLRSEATLSSEAIQGGTATRATVVSRIEANVPVSLSSRVLKDPVMSQERVDTYFSVANSSDEDLYNLTLYAQLPQGVESSKLFLNKGGDCLSRNGCFGRDWVRWNIPSLSAGETKEFSVSLLTEQNLAPATLLSLSPWLEYDNRSIHSGARAFRFHAEKPLVIALQPQSHTLRPGKDTLFNLTYRFNALSAQAENTVLDMGIPEGWQFKSASGNGAFKGGSVSWNLGNLQPENPWGNVAVTLNTSSTASIGKLVTFEAILRDQNARLATAQLNSFVALESPLNVQINTGPKPAFFGENQHIELVVNNNSRFPRANVVVDLRYPEEWLDLHNGFISNGGACGQRLGNASYCDINSEFLRWTLASLPPQSAATLSLSPRVFTTTTNTQDNMVTLIAEARDSSGFESRSTEVIPLAAVQPLKVHITADHNPVLPGELLNLKIPIALQDTGETVNGLNMRLPLPEGVNFVSASHGGIATGNTINWVLGSLSPGNHYLVEATVQVLNDDTLLGKTLRLEPQLSHDGIVVQSNFAVSTTAIIEVEPQRPFDLSIKFSNEKVQAAAATVLSVSVTNTSGFSRSNIDILLRFPEAFNSVLNSDIDSGACELRLGSATRCDVAGEFLRWNVPSLAAGQSVEFSLEATIKEGLPSGSLIMIPTEVSDSTATSHSRGIAVSTGE